MRLTLKEFASRWKLPLTRETIFGPKGFVEADVIRGTKGFIYEGGSHGLAYRSCCDNTLHGYQPRCFIPRGYPGEMQSFITQSLLVETLGIYPTAVPLLNLVECEREMSAYAAMLDKQCSGELPPSQVGPACGNEGT